MDFTLSSLRRLQPAAVVALLILLVQIVQSTGDKIARTLNRRIRRA